MQGVCVEGVSVVIHPLLICTSLGSRMWLLECLSAALSVTAEGLFDR